VLVRLRLHVSNEWTTFVQMFDDWGFIGDRTECEFLLVLA
jgi:hypothetical protein